MDKLAQVIQTFTSQLMLPATAIVILALVISGILFAVGTRGTKELAKGILIGVGIGAVLIFASNSLANWYINTIQF